MTRANTYGEQLRQAAFEAVCRGWPVVPGRSRLSWWTSLLQRTATETTTVGQLEREAAGAEEKCRRALALRQGHQLPIERVAVPITRGAVSYQGLGTVARHLWWRVTVVAG